MKECKHRYAKEWMKYKNMSPWKDSELWHDNRPTWKKVCLKIYRCLPDGLTTRIAGILQVYGRPLRNKLRTLAAKL